MYISNIKQQNLYIQNSNNIKITDSYKYEHEYKSSYGCKNMKLYSLFIRLKGILGKEPTKIILYYVIDTDPIICSECNMLFTDSFGLTDECCENYYECDCNKCNIRCKCEDCTICKRYICICEREIFHCDYCYQEITKEYHYKHKLNIMYHWIKCEVCKKNEDNIL